MDARGFRQWQQVGRSVKGGSKAFYIMVPRMTWRETEQGDEEQIVSGFMAKPVFRYEDTAGKPIQSQTTTRTPGSAAHRKGQRMGNLGQSDTWQLQLLRIFLQTNAEIALATKEESVFFHELAHAAHSKVQTSTGKRPLWSKEIVAELSAAALCRIVGKTSKHLGNSYRYIKHYAKKGNLSPIKACLKVLQDVESTLKLILSQTSEVSQ